MDTMQSELTAKDAIKVAFGMFRDFHDGLFASNVLLEGLEYLEVEHQWRVIIGFDIGRVKETGVTLSFGEQTREPIREFRTFLISAKDGSFVRMS